MPDFISLPFEEDMNQAEIQAMIDTSMKRVIHRFHYPFTAVPAPISGRSAGFAAATLETALGGGGLGPAIIISQSVAATNKIYEAPVVRTVADNFFTDNSDGIVRVGGWFSSFATGATAGTYSGIEAGSREELPPWGATNYHAFAQILWNYTDNRLELHTNVGNDSTVQVQVLTPGTFYGSGGPQSQGGYCEMLIDKYEKRIDCFVEGAPAGSLTDPTKFPDWSGFAGGSGVQLGYVTTSGATGTPKIEAFRVSRFNFEILSIGRPDGY